MLNVVLWTVLFGGAQSGIITVDTSLGEVRGVTTQFARVFRKIPFAEPPLNDLRLSEPTPVSAWRPQILDGTKGFFFEFLFGFKCFCLFVVSKI